MSGDQPIWSETTEEQKAEAHAALIERHQNTMHSPLLHMELHSCRLVKVPMLNSVHQRLLQSSSQLDYGEMENF